MYIFLLILSISYWYCLPVITQGRIGGYSEVRIYELLLVLLMVAMIRHVGKLRIFFQQDRPGRWILRFCIWATATYIFALLWTPHKWILVTLMRLFRLWGFVLAYAAFRIFVKKPRQCERLLDIFLLIGTIQAVTICLQGIGIAPNLWRATWAAGYKNAATGTLGANRTLPGHMMILVFSLAFTYLRNPHVIGTLRVWLARAAFFISIIALLITGSRTAWVVFLVLCFLLLIRYRVKIMAVLLSIIIIIPLLLAIVPSSIKDSIRQRAKGVIRARVVDRLEEVGAKDVIAKFKRIDAGRYNLWTGSLELLIKAIWERPWIILFGGGFNNYMYVTEGIGNSAHNIYITLVFEVGLVGLYLYVMWLRAIWRESIMAVAIGAKMRRQGKKLFLPFAAGPLLISIAVSIFGGEILYPYQPCYAFMGFFLFLYAMMNHPVLVYPNRNTH